MLQLDDDKDATMLNKVGRVKGGQAVPIVVCHVTSLTLPSWLQDVDFMCGGAASF